MAKNLIWRLTGTLVTNQGTVITGVAARPRLGLDQTCLIGPAPVESFWRRFTLGAENDAHNSSYATI